MLRSACFRHVLLKFHSSLRLAGQVPDSYLGYHPPRLQRPRLWLGRRSLQHRGARLEVNHSLPPLRCLHGDARGHWCCAPVLAGQPCHMHVGLLVTKRASHAMAHPWCIISPIVPSRVQTGKNNTTSASPVVVDGIARCVSLPCPSASIRYTSHLSFPPCGIPEPVLTPWQAPHSLRAVLCSAEAKSAMGQF